MLRFRNPMARHTLYAYPDGRIPATTFCELELTLTQLLQTVSWCQSPRVVSSGNGKEKTVGYNLELPDPGMEETGWYRDIESIATLLAGLVDKTRLTFVIGIHDSSSNISQDLHFIQSQDPDLKRLRAIIGVGEIE
jgi:hypothetical protein